MMTLKRLLTTPFQRSISKKIVGFLLSVSALGFADATFLTIEHYVNRIPPCVVGGCETVLTSAYATVAGIPVALLGSIYYLILLAFCIAYFDTKKDIFLRLASTLIILGFLVSVYLFILQAFVIHAFCQYCLISGALSTILFVTVIVLLNKSRSSDHVSL